MVLDKIPNWCAGSKLSSLGNCHRPTIAEIIDLWKAYKHTTSVIVVSCGSNEPQLMEHLQKIGFKKMRGFKNYGHGTNKTWLLGYQIPKKIWCDSTGYDGKGNWTRTW